jgi:hypothetical protein
MPKGRDNEPAPSAIAGMIALRDKMSAEGFRALCMSLCDEDGAEDGEYATPHERLEDEAYPGGKRATDKGRGAMDGVSLAFDRLATPRRSKSEKSFNEMFPGAGDIKLNDHYPVASRVRA